MAEDVNLNAYFERIGFVGSIAPNLQTLQALQQAHTQAIPFENLTPLLGQPVELDLKSLEQKLVRERRGGYCFEQNTLFLHVLRTLGYDVRAHAARVLWGRDSNAVTERSHMMLTVEINAQTYLVDVGFGTAVPTAPLRLRPDVEQETPHETFRLTGEESFLLEMKLGEEDWRACYRFALTEENPIDIEVFNWYVATHPGSPFLRELRVARPEKGRRLALRDTVFSIHPTGGQTEKRQLTSVAEIKETLTGSFGIALPPADQLDPVLERIVGAPEQAPA